MKTTTTTVDVTSANNGRIFDNNLKKDGKWKKRNEKPFKSI